MQGRAVPPRLELPSFLPSSPSGSNLDEEQTLSSWNVWIKEDIPKDRLEYAKNWGDFKRSAVLRVAEGPMVEICERIDNKSKAVKRILYSAPPYSLLEVLDSTRYFSLCIHLPDAGNKEMFLGIAFYTKEESTSFIRKLWSMIRSPRASARGDNNGNKSNGGNLSSTKNKVNSSRTIAASTEQSKTLPSSFSSPSQLTTSGVVSTSHKKKDKYEEEEDYPTSMWLSLSDEVTLSIFSWLRPKDLCILSQVCLEWNVLACDDSLWKSLYKEAGLPPCERFSQYCQQNMRFSSQLSWKKAYVKQYRRMHPPKVPSKDSKPNKYRQKLEEEQPVKIEEDLLSGDLSLKLVTVGDNYHRIKTNLLHTYVSESYPSGPSIIFDNYCLNVNVGDFSVWLALWDTAGQSCYDRLRPLSYTETDIFLVLFSVVNRDTYNHVISKWIPEIIHFCPDVPIVLIGEEVHLRNDATTIYNLTKAGQTPITRVEGQQLAETLRAQGVCVKGYLECSAKNNYNIKRVFSEAIKAVVVEKWEKRQQERRKGKDKEKCLLS
ncbi:Ras-like GTP-binding protein isoform 1 [Balamuthia mandrillaris]